MTRWKESLGFGKLRTDRILKHRLLRNLLALTPRIGEKNGTKRSSLVDERGVPLSLVVSGVNRHDSVSLNLLLKEPVIGPKEEKSTLLNLCLGAGYIGKKGVVVENSFIPTSGQGVRRRN